MENPTPEARKTEKTRLVRMVLLGFAGIGGLLILGRACGPNDPGDEPGKPSKSAHSADAAPSESRALGFDEVSIGQEYKTSVASQSHRVSQLEEELRFQRQNIEALKGELHK